MANLARGVKWWDQWPLSHFLPACFLCPWSYHIFLPPYFQHSCSDHKIFELWTLTFWYSILQHLVSPLGINKAILSYLTLSYMVATTNGAKLGGGMAPSWRVTLHSWHILEFCLYFDINYTAVKVCGILRHYRIWQTDTAKICNTASIDVITTTICQHSTHKLKGSLIVNECWKASRGFYHGSRWWTVSAGCLVNFNCKPLTLLHKWSYKLTLHKQGFEDMFGW